MAETKRVTKEYRGDNLSQSELLNKYLQLQRLGQLQGKDIDWESLEDYYVAENNPETWINEEGEEVHDKIIGED